MWYPPTSWLVPLEPGLNRKLREAAVGLRGKGWEGGTEREPSLAAMPPAGCAPQPGQWELEGRLLCPV